MMIYVKCFIIIYYIDENVIRIFKIFDEIGWLWLLFDNLIIKIKYLMMFS